MRLIDADALLEKLNYQGRFCEDDEMYNLITDAPTIEADSASEIAELKDANLCKTHCPACGSDTANTNEAKINKLNRELQANIHVLREALEEMERINRE